MISKEQALCNVSRAYLERLCANRLYWDNVTCYETERDYYAKSEQFDTMRKAYIECDVMTYDEANAVTEGKYKLVKIEPTATE